MLPKEKLQEYLERWKERLRLRDWFVVVKWTKEDDENGMDKCAGRVDIRPSIFEAAIELNANSKHLPDEDVEETIYHELAHIKVKEVFWSLRQVLRDMKTEDNDDIGPIESLLDSCEEEMVRNIEFLISRIKRKPRYLIRRRGEDES